MFRDVRENIEPINEGQMQWKEKLKSKKNAKKLKCGCEN